MANRRKGYSPKFKFQVVLETLKKDRADAEVARSFGVHPITLSKWKAHFFEHGPEVFGGDQALADYEKRIAEMERMLGQKEVEIALLKNFLTAR